MMGFWKWISKDTFPMLSTVFWIFLIVFKFWRRNGTCGKIIWHFSCKIRDQTKLPERQTFSNSWPTQKIVDARGSWRVGNWRKKQINHYRKPAQVHSCPVVSFWIFSTSSTSVVLFDVFFYTKKDYFVKVCS